MKKKRPSIAPLLIFLSLVVLVASLTVAASAWAEYIGITKIKSIQFAGAHLLPAEEYERSLQPLLGVPLDEIDLNDVRMLMEAHPFVKAARVSRHYPYTLRVEIRERQPIAMLNLKPILFVDSEGVILPDMGLSDNLLLPCLSGFNPTPELYPPGHETVSQKVQESVRLMNQIMAVAPALYNNLSEILLNNQDEYVFVLSEYPTRIVIGRENIWEKIKLLNAFENAIGGPRNLSQYRYLDLRYKNQIVVRERA